jgi:hypothetical protein
VLETIVRDNEVDLFKFPVHERDGGRYIGTACGHSHSRS